LVADAQALGDARPHVLHDDVGALGELMDDLAALWRLQVDRERALAAIPAVEARQLAERIALERLDLDHRRAEVGQLHRGVGAGDVARQVDDLDTVERRRGRGHGAVGAPATSWRAGRSARGGSRRRRTSTRAPWRA